ISYFQFEGCLNKRYANLSGGEKQRLTIILVLRKDTPLVFLDEVTSGLDFETRQKLMQGLNTWYEGKNTTLCIVSHYYEELEQLANKLLILEKGRVMAYGTREELFYKYCGKTLYILENNEKNREYKKLYKSVLAPEHLIALTCDTEEEERSLTNLLIHANVDYKRSNSDIEILSINAKAKEFAGAEGGVLIENVIA
ncbi:MAG TPA: ABC transporter ATP-binding protein, partial [Lachnoclostridium phytofermentans]